MQSFPSAPIKAVAHSPVLSNPHWPSCQVNPRPRGSTLVICHYSIWATVKKMNTLKKGKISLSTKTSYLSMTIWQTVWLFNTVREWLRKTRNIKMPHRTGALNALLNEALLFCRRVQLWWPDFRRISQKCSLGWKLVLCRPGWSITLMMLNVGHAKV